MAEVSTEKKRGEKGGGGIIKKGKKLSTRVDMTPVVDLAFLLLTFFMLATTFIKPQVMEMILPTKSEDSDDQPKVNEKNVMTVILDGDNKIYWFVGITDPQVELTNYSSEGIRKVLQEQIKSNPKLVILVKLDEGSTYENFVDIFDELTITKPKSFALDELNDNDKEIMQRYLGVTDVQPADLQPTEG